MKKLLTGLVLTISIFSNVHGQSDSIKDRNWSIHFQATTIPQYHFPFNASYTGSNSMLTKETVKTSFTSTVYLGRRLWKNAFAYFDPEIAGGSGLSKALGAAGFPNGETFRIGSPDLKLYVARLYLEQRFPLDKSTEFEDNGLDQLAGASPSKYISVRAGKFSLSDFFDDNDYSHDPRAQFMNWALMSNGAWDYPANTRGYTIGAVVEYHSPVFSLRAAAAQVPTYANGPHLDNNIGEALGFTLEAERSFSINQRKGVLKALFFHNKARMGNYREAVEKNPSAPDIVAVRAYGNNKTGVTLNWQQELSKSLGAFFRAGWNDGKNETWAFTEIDQSLSGGISLQGNSWNRPRDVLGAAFVLNGISAPHRDYLKAGGYGFIIGDGALNYGLENIYEVYYSFKIPKIFLTLSPDYQFILHPAYNKDRGPVHIIALRAHIEI